MVGTPGVGTSKSLNVTSGTLPVLPELQTDHLFPPRRHRRGVWFNQTKIRGRLVDPPTKRRSKLMFKDSNYPALIGRVLITVPFLLSGVGKIAAPAATQGYIAAVGLPFPLLGYAIAVAIEVGGSMLLLLGFKSRLT